MIRKTALALSVLIGAWSTYIWLRGGVTIDVGAWHLSSHNARNPALVAVALVAIAWMIAPAGNRWRALANDGVGFARAAKRTAARVGGVEAALAAIAALAIATFGLTHVSPIAAGADSYGYTSQAHLWAAGRVEIDQPLFVDLGGLVPLEALAPFGYRPSVHPPAIVPVYSPGLPMLMGALERLAGPRAVFVVVPLLGGVAVWATFLMGRRIDGPATGAAAAVLLATSPAFLAQLVRPESDVAVAAWWAVSLVLASGSGRGSAALAGVATGAAILTRPNLVLLGAIAGGLVVWTAARDRSRIAITRAALFAIGVIPACLVVAWLNAQWYGSMFTSGYGALAGLFSWTNVLPNLDRYPVWLAERHTPLIALAFVGPWLAGRARTVAIGWLLFALTVVGSYLVYQPWPDSGNVRYMMPALPAMLVLTSVVLVWIAGRLPVRVRTACLVGGIALLAWRNAHFATSHHLLDFQEDSRYAVAGDAIAARLPARAVVFAVEHSGSARYYSGFTTIRFDWTPPDHFDQVVDALVRLGRHPFLLVESWEEPQFRETFKGHSHRAALDWPAMLQVRFPVVSLYDLVDPAPGSPPVATEILQLPSERLTLGSHFVR